jgi:alpha-glucosidase
MIAVGGVADLYFITDSSPASVVSGYLEIVGKPVLLPQWTLGWH